MRIAFTSCCSIRLVPDQRVWADILGQQPEHVVLLGDNIYNDVPDTGMTALQEMTTLEFARHMWSRYRQQLAEPNFRALVRADGVTLHAIWDDHDFAWNDAEGGRLLKQPGQREKIYISTSCMRAFRQALASKNPDNFPQSINDAALWADSPPQTFQTLGASSLQLGTDGRCWLHLTDGRTWRKRPDLLGPIQREFLAGVIAGAPHALHIFASGSTFSGSGGWSRFDTDLHWLDGQIGDNTWLMLSGDIHRNQLAQHDLNYGHLVEATSSGAALRAYLNAALPGPELRNFGLLDVDAMQVQLRLLSFNAVTDSRTYARTVAGGLIPH